ncbi:hypothetical protein JVU11DRAFT_8001 [Chiua virens]|nr:hypothetical protein JVU11DRAFT_8001 [Chiua virens]
MDPSMNAVAVKASPYPTSGEQYRRHVRGDDNGIAKVPAPKYRYAAPSAPWPWMKFDVDATSVHFPSNAPGSTNASECHWNQYPQNLFANWTPNQVKRSQMLTRCSDCEASIVYKVNMFDDGKFCSQKEARSVRANDMAHLQAYWNDLKPPPPSNVRIQALFIEDMTVPVLQMFGTRYNVEPFFFASSANWIPSRYQEDPKALEDHITVILPFIRTLKNQCQRPVTRTRQATFTSAESRSEEAEIQLPYEVSDEKEIIDTRAPLPLPGKSYCLSSQTRTKLDTSKENKVLIQDLLSLHIVRNTTTSTIISCHPSSKFVTTSANRLQSLVKRMGDSRSKDPTLLFLAILWYALYAWDEAFEVLYRYINALEYDVLQFNNIKLTRELHNLQAHILYYQQLLRDFCRSVEFVRDTPNPAMNAPWISEIEREVSAKLLRTEANNLISEIERLSRQRELLSDRLGNAINLAFATVNIQDSKAMQKLAEASMKDSAVMKQLGYITMVYLPASYLANTFSMNVYQINPPTTGTLAQYVEITVGLTLLTSWIAIALQKYNPFYPANSGVLCRALWPLFCAYDFISRETRRWRRLRDNRSLPNIRPSH